MLSKIGLKSEMCYILQKHAVVTHLRRHRLGVTHRRRSMPSDLHLTRSMSPNTQKQRCVSDLLRYARLLYWYAASDVN